MDISSEMIHALLPVFLVVGARRERRRGRLIEGIAEATASITKVFSGALSDRLGKRKRLAVLGYGLAALTKPLFALAPTVGWVLAARFVDRVGKGIRGAPRDALIADVTPAELRGAAFGLRQALDTVGAFAGPLLAIGADAASLRRRLPRRVLGRRDSRRRSPSPLLRLRRARAGAPAGAATRAAARRCARASSARSGAPYWCGGRRWARCFTLARFSEAFLVLRAQDVGLALALVPLVLVVMNVVYAAVGLSGRRAFGPHRAAAPCSASGSSC